MRTIITLLTALILSVFTFTACSSQSAPEPDTITVATTAGADVEILEKARDVAAKNGLTVKIIEFSDYVRPNIALYDGDVDLNSFQHMPYLESFNQERKFNLVSIGTTYISPIGFFSKKIKSLDELKTGDKLAIPNDPSNGGRALLLLEKAGFIKLREGVGLTATPYDIVENPLDLKIVEVDAAQTPRTLDDMTASAVNNTFAIPAGLNPIKDAIYLEDMDSPYVNIIAAKPEKKDNPLYKKFVEAYQSQEVADFILTRFQGSTLPAFEYQKPAPEPSENLEPATADEPEPSESLEPATADEPDPSDSPEPEAGTAGEPEPQQELQPEG